MIAHAKGHTPPKIIGVFLLLTALNAVGVIKMLDGLEAVGEEATERGSTPAIALSIGLRQLKESRYWIHHAITPTIRCRWSFYCIFTTLGKILLDMVCRMIKL